MDRRVGPNRLKPHQVAIIRKVEAAGWPREKIARVFATDVSNVGYVVRRDTHK